MFRQSNQRNKWRALLLAVISSVFISGCETTGGQKQTVGTLLGAAGGALLGTQVGSGSGRIAAVIAGGILGAGIGNQIGKYLDERDQELQAKATANALSTPGINQQTWANPKGNSGTVSASPSEPTAQAQYAECRTVERTLDANQDLKDELRFCRQTDGPWTRVT